MTGLSPPLVNHHEDWLRQLAGATTKIPFCQATSLSKVRLKNAETNLGIQSSILPTLICSTNCVFIYSPTMKFRARYGSAEAKEPPAFGLF